MHNFLFVLPAGGYSGGANSVVQEVRGLRRIGINANIAVDQRNIASFRKCYSTEFDILQDIHSFKSYKEFEIHLEKYDVVIATVSTHASELFSTTRNANNKSNKRIQIGYYIQDYEPLFFQPGSPDWMLAKSSYDDAKDVICFAKTDWLCRVVEQNHSIKVRRVQPSIDHDCYSPNLGDREKISISAMLRTGTARRAPRRTARILNRVKEKYKDAVEIFVFGSSDDEILENGIILNSGIQNQGRLTRDQVAQTLRDSSLFLDLSDYQAFGRTGIESMACGAIPVMPIHGGAPEFIKHSQNGYLVDTRVDDLVIDVIDEFIGLPPKRRNSMRTSALELAAVFSIHRSAISVLNTLQQNI